MSFLKYIYFFQVGSESGWGKIPGYGFATVLLDMVLISVGNPEIGSHV